MRINNSFTKGWKPVTIAMGLMAGVSTNLYADVDQFSQVYTVLNSSNTSKYIQEVDDAFDISMSLRRRFYNHYNTWYRQTRMHSSVNRIVSHPDFKAIVSMGYNAVPFILEELDARPSNLVWALNMIFQKKITLKPNTTIDDACKLWVKELKRK